MFRSKEKQFEISDVSDLDLPPDAWKVRPCEWYKDEYKNCTGMQSRFNQYYIYGEVLDCSNWKKDYQDCMIFRKNHDLKAIEKVIESENQRKKKRNEASYNNDVWQYRSKPPENWNSEMPDWMIERKKNSLLIETQAKLNEGIEPPHIFTGFNCSIL
ncbi:UPF0545 protein C22orf39 homolog [Uloborus diversus]|uniref:UPF0545 protein C22orf39 homolog n=1 Tax=Uloborus diversus TaxID=327109 RepID=UPI0024099531|nr:UPF0545 protein C22orf39 homolog [Uloborus diversus]